MVVNTSKKHKLFFDFVTERFIQKAMIVEINKMSSKNFIVGAGFTNTIKKDFFLYISPNQII